MQKFKNISYLKSGNPKQRKVHQLLVDFKIVETLKNYNPLVVGTIPIEIDLEESDVDIILQTDNFEELFHKLNDLFQNFDQFSIEFKPNENILICNFSIEKIPFEIYAEKKPTHLQYGFLHMIKEHQIIQKFGKKFQNQIIQLKKQGYKTEPAFAKLLNLKGNPYEELLRYKV